MTALQRVAIRREMDCKELRLTGILAQRASMSQRRPGAPSAHPPLEPSRPRVTAGAVVRVCRGPGFADSSSRPSPSRRRARSADTSRPASRGSSRPPSRSGSVERCAYPALSAWLSCALSGRGRKERVLDVVRSRPATAAAGSGSSAAAAAAKKQLALAQSGSGRGGGGKPSGALLRFEAWGLKADTPYRFHIQAVRTPMLLAADRSVNCSRCAIRQT